MDRVSFLSLEKGKRWLILQWPALEEGGVKGCGLQQCFIGKCNFRGICYGASRMFRKGQVVLLENSFQEHLLNHLGGVVVPK